MATTGAGKTEIVYPLIEWALNRDLKVLFAAPRRDVVLELEPRLRQAFAQHDLAVLYGGSGNRWAQGELTLATTHQLLRFHQRFDLVILDEIDAFPYHNNPVLQYAASKACRSDGKIVWLTATPPSQVKREIRRGMFPFAVIPVRYHRYPLPLPVHLPCRRGAGRRTQLPREFIRQLQNSLNRGARIFVFVARIREVAPLVNRLRIGLEDSLASATIQGTSSQDELRMEKVQLFRTGDIRLLVTTTILERGVTMAKSDVFIWGADSPIFDAAALVQMAGRAGRSMDDPAGRVFFLSTEKTNSQMQALREIKQMNEWARKEGYLRHDNNQA